MSDNITPRQQVVILQERATGLLGQLNAVNRASGGLFGSFWRDVRGTLDRAVTRFESHMREISDLRDRLSNIQIFSNNQQREVQRLENAISDSEASRSVLEQRVLQLEEELRQARQVESGRLVSRGNTPVPLARQVFEAQRSRSVTPLGNRAEGYIDASTGLSSPFRAPPAVEPGTSPARMIARDDHHSAMDIQAASYEAQLSKTVRAIYDLNPQWARDFLVGKRTRVTNGGCWECDNAADSSKGYVKFNIGNTIKPGGQLTFNQAVPGPGNINPFAHQLGAVAAGLGQMLMNTVTNAASYQVSHLCHNGSCFNPEHLTIESAVLNKARNTCQGQVITICSCGQIYNSCCHGSTEMQKRCLLPTARVQCGHAYANLDGNNYRHGVALLRDMGPSRV
jgi:hypothetical protein